jgi:hypothetical protein
LQEKGLAVTIKLLGGTPDVGHNHDDAGSYAITVDGELIAGEVGGTKWYTNNRINSK